MRREEKNTRGERGKGGERREEESAREAQGGPLGLQHQAQQEADAGFSHGHVTYGRGVLWGLNPALRSTHKGLQIQPPPLPPCFEACARLGFPVTPNQARGTCPEGPRPSERAPAQAPRSPGFRPACYVFVTLGPGARGFTERTWVSTGRPSEECESSGPELGTQAK